MLRRFAAGMTALVVVTAVCQPAQAFFKKKACCPEPCCVEYHTVEKTVMVPEWVTETRKVSCTEYKPVEQEKVVTVYERKLETKAVERQVCVMVPETRSCVQKYWVCVPEWKEVQHTYTVMVPETKTRTETYTVCVPEWKEEERTYTMMVAHSEKKQGTRHVCKMVEAKEMRTVCEDKGHWDEQTCVTSCKVKVDACGNCCVVPVTCTKKVWVPNVVKSEVEVTVCKPTMVEEPYEYCVTVCKPVEKTHMVKVCTYRNEERTRNVCYTVCKPVQKTCTQKVCSYRREERTRNHTYTVCVPTTKTVTENVTCCKCVPVQKTVKCTVMVPTQVEKEVQVQVCKMVPKSVTCQVAHKVACAPAPCEPACEKPCCN